MAAVVPDRRISQVGRTLSAFPASAGRDSVAAGANGILS
jgi:hypothetical protein